MDYKKIAGLSNEAIEKLSKSQPTTIGSASRIEGVTPAAINLILIQIKKREILKNA
jgi:tRNA uridine 5-carboxymethylaminomethyl modification enzyme